MDIATASTGKGGGEYVIVVVASVVWGTEEETIGTVVDWLGRRKKEEVQKQRGRVNTTYMRVRMKNDAPKTVSNHSKILCDLFRFHLFYQV